MWEPVCLFVFCVLHLLLLLPGEYLHIYCDDANADADDSVIKKALSD